MDGQQISNEGGWNPKYLLFYFENLCILCVTLADPDQLSPIGQAWHRGDSSYQSMFSTALSTLASISTASMTSRLTNVTRWVASEKIWRGSETLLVVIVDIQLKILNSSKINELTECPVFQVGTSCFDVTINEPSYQVATSPPAGLPLTLPLVSDLFPGPRVVERLQIFSLSRMRLKKTKKTLAHTNLPKLVHVPEHSHNKVQTNVLDFLCFIIDIILPTTGRYTGTIHFVENPQLFQHFLIFTRSCWYCTCSGSPCAWGWSSWAGEATRQGSEQCNGASEQPPVPEPLLGLHQPQRPRPRLLRRDQARHPPQEEECRGRVLSQGGRGSDPRQEDKYLRRHFWHNSLHISYIIKGA